MMQVMFVCVHNAGRSQMAEACFNALAPEWMHAISAGTQPTAQVNPTVVAAMTEVGIAMTGHQPKLATPELVTASDRIITMGCGVQESCPLYLGMKIDEDWGLADPAGQGIEAVRPIRDAVRAHVEDLIARLSEENRPMADKKPEEIRDAVRENYAGVAKRDGAGGCCCSPSCCSGDGEIILMDSIKLGYSADDLTAVPQGANMGLGCGNPQAIAALQPGEVVLDLGSGGGFDCFLAAQRVGQTGRVIGVDMTPEMISKARQNAEVGRYTNVEFRLGEIEALPVADSTADVIMSNCVINLSPEKPRVFREAYRTLKPGGRLAISDVVATADIPENVRQDLALYSGCIAGASTIAALETMLHEAGFAKVRIEPNDASRSFIREWAPGRSIEEYVVSASITAVKPQREATPCDR